MGTGGTILKTINGGSNWDERIAGTSNDLESVAFTDALTGYAVGTGGTILKTINGGSNWTAQSAGTSNDLESVVFIDALTGYAVGESGIILKTIWLPQNAGTSNDLESVAFTDALTGYTVGENGIILKTINGGSNWTPQSAGTSNDLESVDFVDALIGYVVGQGGIILKTVDGGSNWTAQSSGTGRLLISVDFVDALTGYAVGGDGTILKTVDGGANWIAKSSGIIADLESVDFVDALTGYTVGRSGTILKTINGGSNWTVQSAGTSNRLYSVDFVDALIGYAVGLDGTILKTVDGGSNWTAQSAGIIADLESVIFTDALTGYTVGVNGTMLKTVDGGANWTAQSAGTDQGLHSIIFIGSHTAYVIGENGTILGALATDIDIQQNQRSILINESYDFGNIKVDQASPDSSFTIKNEGSRDLVLYGTEGNLLVLGGADVNQFVLTQNTIRSPIVPVSSQNFSIQFVPTSLGRKNATLTIHSNAPDEGTYVMNLTGVGTNNYNLVVDTVGNNTVRLQWEESLEDETGFAIFRSLGFFSSPDEVGRVDANTTTFTDRSAVYLPGITYNYQVQAIGSVDDSFSNTVGAVPLPTDIVAPIQGGSVEEINQSFFIYPNPLEDDILKVFIPSFAGTTIFHIFDSQGNQVQSLESVGEVEVELDLSALASGWYILQMTQRRRIETRSFVKY